MTNVKKDEQRRTEQETTSKKRKTLNRKHRGMFTKNLRERMQKKIILIIVSVIWRKDIRRSSKSWEHTEWEQHDEKHIVGILECDGWGLWQIWVLIRNWKGKPCYFVGCGDVASLSKQSRQYCKELPPDYVETGDDELFMEKKKITSSWKKHCAMRFIKKKSSGCAMSCTYLATFYFRWFFNILLFFCANAKFGIRKTRKPL